MNMQIYLLVLIEPLGLVVVLQEKRILKIYGVIVFPSKENQSLLSLILFRFTGVRMYRSRLVIAIKGPYVLF